MNAIVDFLSHRNIHKLAGVALAGLGLASGVSTTTGWREVTMGTAYAAIMHIVGAIKKVPDTPLKSPVA